MPTTWLAARYGMTSLAVVAVDWSLRLRVCHQAVTRRVQRLDAREGYGEKEVEGFMEMLLVLVVD